MHRYLAPTRNNTSLRSLTNTKYGNYFPKITDTTWMNNLEAQYDPEIGYNLDYTKRLDFESHLGAFNYNNKYEYAEIIVIDEAQFYDDLYEFMRTELFSTTNKKLFLVAGLSGDYNMEPIGDILKLIPMADDIKKLDAYCIYCKDGTIASFTSKLIKNDNKQIEVGKDDIYSPCCRDHYLSFYKNLT